MSIQDHLRKLGITDFNIDSDGKITVFQNIYWSNKEFTKIPIKIHQVRGNVYLQNNLLETLENSPTYVWGSFDCSNNKLKSLQYGPYLVHKKLDCSNNFEISSIDYWPINNLASYYSRIDIYFGSAQIYIYEYCLKNFIWQPELTLVQNMEVMFKYLPHAIKDLNEYVMRDPNLSNHSFRGASLADNLGII